MTQFPSPAIGALQRDLRAFLDEHVNVEMVGLEAAPGNALRGWALNGQGQWVRHPGLDALLGRGGPDGLDMRDAVEWLGPDPGGQFDAVASHRSLESKARLAPGRAKPGTR